MKKFSVYGTTHAFLHHTPTTRHLNMWLGISLDILLLSLVVYINNELLITFSIIPYM